MSETCVQGCNAVEMGCKNLVFFTKKLKSPNFRFFRKNLTNPESQYKNYYISV